MPVKSRVPTHTAAGVLHLSLRAFSTYLKHLDTTRMFLNANRVCFSGSLSRFGFEVVLNERNLELNVSVLWNSV